MSSTIKLLAFAGARDVLGAGELELPLGAPCTASELLDDLCARYPSLLPHRRSVRLAVNGVYAHGSDPVKPGDEVAIIPPVAGG